MSREATAREMNQVSVIMTVETDKWPRAFGIWTRGQRDHLGTVMANNRYEAVAKYFDENVV